LAFRMDVVCRRWNRPTGCSPLFPDSCVSVGKEGDSFDRGVGPAGKAAAWRKEVESQSDHHCGSCRPGVCSSYNSLGYVWRSAGFTTTVLPGLSAYHLDSHAAG